MTASLRGIAVLAAVAVLMLVAALTGGREEAVDRALLPGVDIGSIRQLAWSRGKGADVVATRGSDGWSVDEAPADADTIDAVLTALRGGRWQRRADVDAAGEVVSQLRVADVTIGIAQPLPGTDQQWVVAGDHALLVDAWVARALDPPPLALHVRKPFADVRTGWTLDLDGYAIDLGTRLAIPLVGSSADAERLRLAPAVIDRIVRALEDLEVDRFDRPRPPGRQHTFEARPPGCATGGSCARSVTLGGDCPTAPGRVISNGWNGVGCVDRAAVAELDAAIQALDAARDPTTIATVIDRRPAADAQTVQLDGGATIDLRKTLIAGQPADPEAVGALFAALAAPCDVVPLPVVPARATLTVTDRGNHVTQLEVRGDVGVRTGEPVGLKPSPDALSALLGPSQLFRDRQLWLEEPTAIATLSIDGETLHRGAVVGEWDTQPARFAAIDLLAAAVASPRALPTPDVPPQDGLTNSHRVAFTTAPPAGAPAHHDLTVALARDGRCVAHTDVARYVERALCDAVAAVISHAP